MRIAVVDALIAEGKPKTAFRYAMCGTADQLVRKSGAVSVAPKGCGHPMCPRCGRKSAGRHVRRVQGWLGYEAHGDLVNVCFTQLAIQGETLKQARARLAKKLRAFMVWATREGLVAGMTVHHAAVSGSIQAMGAWHYHAHAILEFPEGRLAWTDGVGNREGKKVSDELSDKWVVIAKRNGEEVMPLWNHRLLSHGPAIEGLRGDSGDADFWSESKDAVARVIQYPMRDLAQGVSAWKLGGDYEKVTVKVRELVKDARGWKMRRAWGRWRKKCPAEIAALAEEKKLVEDGEETAAASPPSATPLGTMRRVFHAARAGNGWARGALIELESSVRNNTRFARRLVAWVRAGLNMERDGP